MEWYYFYPILKMTVYKIHKYVSEYICIYMHICVYTYINIYTLYIHKHICICICTYIHIYMHIHTYIHIKYTYTHQYIPYQENGSKICSVCLLIGRWARGPKPRPQTLTQLSLLIKKIIYKYIFLHINIRTYKYMYIDI
jgi:hypothetical protein